MWMVMKPMRMVPMKMMQMVQMKTIHMAMECTGMGEDMTDHQNRMILIRTREARMRGRIQGNRRTSQGKTKIIIYKM